MNETKVLNKKDTYMGYLYNKPAKVYVQLSDDITTYDISQEHVYQLFVPYKTHTAALL